ncbi:DegT/DnrJ/EryC1/StrS aminotransferase [Streptomyces cinnamoneus]|uniref:DegT/DnrJ/EryC1/StrS aminotransferase n=1 Tax=Streptomyces cinnamoneus TaxID=53446 RepID=A0A2G1XPD5_STRCJ|nr:DegT/DnrJ/EryC1/StrS family aminotransferase [Streptomyces cinnamoneus]PHQ53094.1 DegT/DnrJ/EryC1/StrS aminotransferase [Streptomyces cinnamoneus]PPT15408.1 DegT/DnrJ/EryC1/StrS aminotransferase [Streptomyces cinnamoneus]
MGTQEKLAAAGVGPGDEVIVPSYGPSEPAEAVRNAGALPVFADIDPVTFCLDPASVADAVSRRTAAIVPVHLFGHLADLAALQSLACRDGLLLVAPDAPEEGTGGTAGSAVDSRRANAAFLGARLTGVVTPSAAPGVRHRYESYVVRVPGNGRPDRDAFARALRARGIHCRVPVQTPVHRMPLFRQELWLTETERAADECLALPVDAGMSRRELHRVVSACNALGGLMPVTAA